MQLSLSTAWSSLIAFPDGTASKLPYAQKIATHLAGRADRNSFRVLSSTHPLFSDAVSRALHWWWLSLTRLNRPPSGLS